MEGTFIGFAIFFCTFILIKILQNLANTKNNIEKVRLEEEAINSRTRAVSTIASILISGTLANPRYSKEIKELEEWAWDYRKSINLPEEWEKMQKEKEERSDHFSEMNVLLKGRKPYIR